jgi:hypothetical protein
MFKFSFNAWQTWPERAVAWLPAQMQIVYGIHGEKLLGEPEAS